MSTPTPVTPAPKKPSIFARIAAGLEWFGKEIGKGLAFLPKIIVLANDAEQSAKEIVPQVLKVIQDAGALAVAVAKDGGVFLTAFAALAAAITVAIASKALSVTADEAVVAAFENFVSKFKSEDVADVITALDTLVSDVKTLDAMGLAALKKMEADA
jgi:hypothetical protein